MLLSFEEKQHTTNLQKVVRLEKKTQTIISTVNETMTQNTRPVHTKNNVFILWYSLILRTIFRITSLSSFVIFIKNIVLVLGV